ncbi:hypothetical protein GTR02_10590 [Kineococcus sp. R8]|uniref:CG0192-related protein n=1 Tax=Kineococcus siccus TaxID=2696567 RepID=UPI001412406E|nr:hypothetical protein [Kineococcus siccus]NAZ82265.1 hypothetical protein [Kineococcus siccus]
MAVHHPATIVPTKLELLQAWVPHQPWVGRADASVLTRLGSYRFDDPDGEVGVETHLLGTVDGQVLQVPLTYRGAPRRGADDSLITTMTHTTLGDRWIYDGCQDPVYVSTLVTAILTGGREADLYAATDAGLVLEAATTHVRGSGTWSAVNVADASAIVVVHHESTTEITAGRAEAAVTLTISRVMSSVDTARDERPSLTGTWPGQETPVVLATVDRAS